METKQKYYGLFRGYVETRIGDITPSIVTFYPTEKEADEMAEKLGKLYCVKEVDCEGHEI